ncbi:transglutaminase-like domain-containing protein [Nanoarchaeota archaeon]
MEELDYEENKAQPLKIIMALILILIIITGFYLVYFIKYDPYPSYTPTIEEVIQDLQLKNISHNLDELGWTKFYYPSDPQIKLIANKIAKLSCSSYNNICYAKAMFLFVQKNVQYVKDPNFEYIETPEETLSSGTADCDGHAVLLANLLGAVGIDNQFEFSPNHIYNKIYINGYRNNNWIPIDATCKHCKFGQTP